MLAAAWRRIGSERERQLRCGSVVYVHSTLNYPNDLGFSPDGRYLYVNEIADNSSDGMLLAPTRIRRIEMPLR